PNYPIALADLLERPEFRENAGRANRDWALREFSWETISPALGGELQRALGRKRQDAKAYRPEPTAPPPKVSSGVGASSANIGGVQESPIAILSTFGIKCGIAEYTSY